VRRGAAFLAVLMAGGCGDEPREPREMTADEVAAELADMRIAPGLWELTSEVVDVRAPDLPQEVRQRMIGPRARLRHCITAEQAAHPSATFLAGHPESECAYRGFTVEGGRLRGAMTCPEASATMAGRYGPEAYDLRMEMASPMPNGATMTLELRSRGRRIGDCEDGEEG
jgi:hypothetical protein